MKTKICKKNGCERTALPGESYCLHHVQLKDKEQKEKRRKMFTNTTRAGNYHTSQWGKLRKSVREEHPFCQYCGSNEHLEVHHVVPVRYAPERMLDRDNLIVLCSSCHKAVTRREIAERKRLDR